MKKLLLLGGVLLASSVQVIASTDLNGSVSDSPAWTRQVGYPGGETHGTAVATNSAGNIYVTGYTDEETNESQTGIWDYYVTKYDSAKNVIWSRQKGTLGGQAFGQGISADAAGNVYITGYTNAGLSGGTQNGVYDYFVAKYDANGNLLWTRQVGAAGGDTEGKAIVVDNNGVYVTGTTNAAISNQKKIGSLDYFIAKYDTNGSLLWTVESGAYSYLTSLQGITADSLGNIYASGYTSGNMDGAGSNYGGSLLVVKYDMNGNKIWLKQIRADGASSNAVFNGAGISVDGANNVYVAGVTNRGVYGKQKQGDFDCFIFRFTPDGIVVWNKQLGAGGSSQSGNANMTYCQAISSDKSGNNIYVTGRTTVGLNGQVQNGIYDYFIAKYNSFADPLWNQQVGTSGGTTRGYGVSTDNLGNTYVTGDTDKGISGQTKVGVWDYFLSKYIK